MKLAIINYKILFDKDSKKTMDSVIILLKMRGIDSVVESTFSKFEIKFGSLNNYDGLLIHPGVHAQRDLKVIKEKYPDLKFAFATMMAGKKEYNFNPPMFDFSFAIDEIVKYFSDNKI